MVRKGMIRKSATASFGIAALTSMAAVGGFVHPMNAAPSRQFIPPSSSSSSSPTPPPPPLRMSPPSDDMSGVNGNNWADQSSSSSPSSPSPSSPSLDGQPPVDDVAAMESSSTSSSSSSSSSYPGGEDAVGWYARATLGTRTGDDVVDVGGHPGEMTASPTSDARRRRLAREAAIRSVFASGDELHEMRSRVVALGRELADARSSSSALAAAMARELSSEISNMNDRDPEFAYAMARELMDRAMSDGDTASMVEYKRKMEDARSCIPQLNLHGLWVGKYGEHGYEMINVTYVDDGHTLVATKVTGDENVPRGEVTFTVDLTPRLYSSGNDLLAGRRGQTISSSRSSSSSSSSSRDRLDPIELDESARQRWGRRYLPRHHGRGRVASANFSNPRWMEGQMILVGDFFSFAWIPIGRQIFFGRPSAELTISMMREAERGSNRRGVDEDDGVGAMRDVAMNMLEETYWVERESQGHNDGENGIGCEGCFE